MTIKILLGIILGGSLGALLGYFGKCKGSLCMLSSNPWLGALWGAALGLYIVLSLKKN